MTLSRSADHLLKAHCCAMDEVSALASSLTSSAVPADDRRHKVKLLALALDDLLALEPIVARIHNNTTQESERA